MKLTKENWIVLGLAGSVAVVSLLAVYRPQNAKLEGLRTEIATKRLALDADRNKAAVVPDLMRRVQSLKNRYKDFDRKLPKSKELGGFLQEISGIQRESALSDGLMETGSPTSEDLFNTMPIQMKFKGSYLALASFLKNIERMQRLTRVQRLMILTPREDNKPMEFELFMNIYFTKS
ncbi:MAG: type 4a pilus biogenesis protein PilO [Phycisphaerae bacterium]|jgi:Tfp pilus assembly protein PilO